MRTLFDSNAINDLFRSCHGTEVRRRLRREIRRGRIEVLFSIMQMTELAGTYPRPEIYKQLVSEMLHLSGGRLLQAYPHRLHDELRLRRRLRRGEMFYKRNEAKPLLRNVFDLDQATLADGQRRAAKTAFEEMDRTARAAVASWKNIEMDWAAWLARWRKDRPAVITDWSLDRIAKAYGLQRTDERIVALDPQRFPTIWSDTAYHLARIALTAQTAKLADGNDAYDQAHFSDAAYANVFVTSDRWFRKVVDESGLERPRVLTFTEFAAELGVVTAA